MPTALREPSSAARRATDYLVRLFDRFVTERVETPYGQDVFPAHRLRAAAGCRFRGSANGPTRKATAAALFAAARQRPGEEQENSRLPEDMRIKMEIARADAEYKKTLEDADKLFRF